MNGRHEAWDYCTAGGCAMATGIVCNLEGNVCNLDCTGERMTNDEW